MPSKPENVVIIGGGPAGAECAAALRMLGFDGSVTVVSADPHMPYSLPALSKSYLLGTATFEEILIRPVATYTDHDIEVRIGSTVAGIDRSAGRVQLADGESLPYERLVIATGSRPRPLPDRLISDGANIRYLRSVTDADALRGLLHPDSRIAIIGGGVLGLEVAAAARSHGAAVTVIEALPRLLARITSPPVSAFFARLHREEGVDLRLDTHVVTVGQPTDGAPTSVEIATGERIAADAVLVGIGVIPAVELAEAAGLQVDNGVVVDEYCQTSDPQIYAIGDCTNQPCSEFGGRRRLESLPNAHEQALVAANGVIGRQTPYTSTPWFWTEQYDVTLQTVGLLGPHDEVVLRGSSESGRSFSAFYLRAGEIRAADVISAPRDFAIAKRLVGERRTVSAEQLRDESVPLKGLLARQRTGSAQA